jgi:N-acetylmuramoyl-L-alanine amidase
MYSRSSGQQDRACDPKRSASSGRRLLCIALLSVLLCMIPISGLLTAQPESAKIAFYTAQTTYTLPVLQRDGADYVGLFETLEPIGSVSAKPDGKKWKLRFRDIDSTFENGRNKARIRNLAVELSAPFLLENGRGYIPVASLRSVLPAFVSTDVDVHQESRRVFIGVSPVRLSAKKADAGKVTFVFTAPVNPQIATEPGKLRMLFTREPVVGDASALRFDDKTIPQAAFAEANGAAELVVTAFSPLQATFSDDRKTITVSALAPAPPPAQSASQQPAVPPAQPQANVTKARPHPSVLIDPAHGGDDPGAALTEKVSEKEVTLALARRLKHELEVRGIEAALLRESDSSLTLDQRVAAANTSGAALYVAIHATTSGTGIHLYTAMLPSQPRRPLAFVRVEAAQASSVDASRVVASTMSTDLLKRDMTAVSMPAAVPPLKSIMLPAIAVEVGPPPSKGGEQLTVASYQQMTAVALANAIAAARPRLPQQEVQR